MKSIQVYEPPICCSTGSCGTDLDPNRVNFAAMLVQFSTAGIRVERFSLAHQPLAFAQNEAVKALMIKEGTSVLPVVLWDGEVHLKGRYPTKEERPAWFRAVTYRRVAA